MIKRVLFATLADGAADFEDAFRDAVGEALTAPPAARPVKAVVCLALHDAEPDPRHDAVGLHWFTDAAHLARYQSWLGSPEGLAVGSLFARATDLNASSVVVAQEHVMRGAPWLEQRWHDGGERIKQMAIARRATDLTPGQFAERWRSRAGRTGAVAIPDEARGQAYVQNHPLAQAEGEWAYDAINEVYFDDFNGLRTRTTWFAENFDGEDDLVSQSWFLPLRERPC